MSETFGDTIKLHEGRFSRFESIEWWSQTTVRDARVLVVGAGALGNEVVKNLSLLGIGHVIVIDMDRIECSNLSRSVLFRERDEGQYKADCAAASARDIYPDIDIRSLVGEVQSCAGLGCFRWADVVVGALDNREARVFLNASCARVGTPWVDGGIGVLDGIVRGFAPPRTACYECTMSQTDWAILSERRSCSLLGRRAQLQGGTPTTPTTASVIAAIQVQEIVKLLHGMDALLGRGFVYQGETHQSYSVEYPINPDCGWHEKQPDIVTADDLDSASTIESIWAFAEGQLNGVVAIDLSREIVTSVTCPDCGVTRPVFRPTEAVTADQIRCATCGSEGVPAFCHSLTQGSDLLPMTVKDIGLPPWDIVWARSGDGCIGIELSGDRQMDGTSA